MFNNDKKIFWIILAQFLIALAASLVQSFSHVLPNFAISIVCAKNTELLMALDQDHDQRLESIEKYIKEKETKLYADDS